MEPPFTSYVAFQPGGHWTPDQIIYIQRRKYRVCFFSIGKVRKCRFEPWFFPDAMTCFSPGRFTSPANYKPSTGIRGKTPTINGDKCDFNEPNCGNRFHTVDNWGNPRDLGNWANQNWNLAHNPLGISPMGYWALIQWDFSPTETRETHSNLWLTMTNASLQYSSMIKKRIMQIFRRMIRLFGAIATFVGFFELV